MATLLPHPTAAAMLATVRRHCQRHALLSPGPLVVAVSGGADSLCVLDLLRLLAPEFGLTLQVAHFHHGLRGVEADADARLVAGLADRWDVPGTFGAGDVALAAKQSRRSLEAAAHDVRWRFLDEVRRRVGAAVVATGHTRDDQAETVLMHVLRGSGLAGLAGLPPRRGTVVRPLLPLSHAQAVAWCQARELAWREDASNAEPWCRRNQVRLEVLPFLRRYNPSLDAALARTADALQADVQHLEREASAALRTLQRSGMGGEERLDLAGYQALPEALRRRLLLRWLGDDATTAHVAAADALLTSGRTGDEVVLPGARRLVRSYGEAVLTAAAEPASLPSVALAVPCCIDAPAWGWRIQTTLLDGPVERPGDRWTVDLDAATVHLPLVLRPRRPGDRLALAGLPGPKKLQDIFVDDKIPRRERDRVGVVAAANGIVWLAGQRVAGWAAATPASSRVLRIALHRAGRGTDGS